MSIRRISIALLSACLLFAGCGDSASDDGSSDGNQNTGVGCIGQNDCPDGQFCFNGLCAIGCQSNDDCADDQYCATGEDRMCHNKEVPTCSSDGECKGEQVCTDGYCTAPSQSDEQCEPDSIDDGCSETAICVERDGEDPECVNLPRCSEDGTCPTGQAGAVCNDDYVPQKAEVCLLGACESDSNCPSDWSCVKPQNSVLGTCSSGAFGTPCTEDSQCQSGTCNSLGGFGTCGM